MRSLQASRTLVKSPPELWAELSEIDALARHLGEFGEIRITKTDPESRVEWEADRASGTVRLEPSGWGTRVVLTVDSPEPPAAGAEITDEPAPAAARAAEPVEKPGREPAAAAAPAAEPVEKPGREPAAEPVTEPEPEPAAAAASEAAPEPAATEPAPQPARRGFWARLFRRPEPEPEPEPAPEPVAEPEPEEPVAVEPEPEPEPDLSYGKIEWEAPPPRVEEEPEPAAPAPLGRDEAHAVLTGVLDALGSAHHRPFSRS